MSFLLLTLTCLLLSLLTVLLTNKGAGSHSFALGLLRVASVVAIIALIIACSVRPEFLVENTEQWSQGLREVNRELAFLGSGVATLLAVLPFALLLVAGEVAHSKSLVAIENVEEVVVAPEPAAPRRRTTDEDRKSAADQMAAASESRTRRSRLSDLI